MAILYLKEIERLEELEKELRPARLRGLKHCIKCGYCCNRRTCIPTPDELFEISKFLKMPIDKLINNYFAIDRLYKNGNYFLKPVGINIKDLAGKFIPFDRTYNEGPCIFLDENNDCKIYPVRSRHAKETECWINKKDKKNMMTFDPLNYWDDNALLKYFGLDGKLEGK